MVTTQDTDTAGVVSIKFFGIKFLPVYMLILKVGYPVAKPFAFNSSELRYVEKLLYLFSTNFTLPPKSINTLKET